MAFADLGVRILLEDGASAGFGALSLSMMNVYSRAGLLHSVWGKLPDSIKAAGLAAGATGLAFGGLADFLKNVIDASSQLFQEMANLVVSVNGADKAGAALTDTLINIADNSIYTTATIADGFTTLGVDGWDAKALIDGMGESMARFAEATRSDVVPAANLLGTTMETYGAQSSEAAQYTDDLTFAFYNGQKTIANLQSAFNQVGGTAANLNVPFGELSTTLALLGEDGLKGTQAGSALRYMLTSLTDPTNKAAKELAALGVVVVNNAVPAFTDLRNKLEASGGAAAKAADNYDGTVTSLIQMFTQGQKVGALHTDKSFYEWATASGILKDKLFDANGQFIGIEGTIQQLGSVLDGLNPEQRGQALQQLFNVKGAQAAKLLLDDYQQTLAKFSNLDGIRQATDAEQKAADVTNTLQANIQRLQSTWQDTLARLGNVDMGPLQGAANGISDLLHQFNTAPQSVRDFAGQMLVLATAATGVIFVVSSITFIVGAFGKQIGHMGELLLKGGEGFLSFGGSIGKGALGALTAFSDGVWNAVGFLGKLNAPIQAVEGFLRSLLVTLFQTGVDWAAVGDAIAGFWATISGFFASFGPAISTAISFISQFAGWIATAFTNLPGIISSAGGLTGIMSSLGGAISGVTSSLAAFLAPVATVVGAVLLVAGVVYGVVATFIHWWQTSDKFRAILLDLWKRIQDLGTLLMGQFQQAWKAIQDEIKNLQPTLNQLKEIWQTIQPVLMVIGGIIIGVVVVAIGILIAALKGIISAIGPILVAVISVFGGIVQIITGVIQIIVGVFQILVGLVKGIFTGDWTTLQDGLKKLLAGVLNILGGLWKAIWGLLSGLVKAVIGLIGGFIGGIIDWFKHLFEKLVGHSIVTDLVNAIVRLITMMRAIVISIIQAIVTGAIALFNIFKAGIQLVINAVLVIVNALVTGLLLVVKAISEKIIQPIITLFHMIVSAVLYVVGMVVSNFHAMWNNVMNAFNNAKNLVTGKINEIKNNIITPIQNLGSQLFDSAKNAVQMFINGLGSMIGKVKDKAGEIANGVKNMLGFHSPPKEGPLADSDEYMPNMMNMFASGIERHTDLVRGKAATAAGHIGKALGTISPTAGVSAVGTVMTHAMMASQANANANAVNATYTIQIPIDGEVVGGVVLQQVGKQLILNGVGRTLR